MLDIDLTKVVVDSAEAEKFIRGILKERNDYIDLYINRGDKGTLAEVKGGMLAFVEATEIEIDMVRESWLPKLSEALQTELTNKLDTLQQRLHQARATAIDMRENKYRRPAFR